MEMNNYNSNKNDASLFREMERVNDSTFGESTGFNSPAYINNGYSHPSLPRAPPSYYFQSNPKIIKENQMHPYYNDLSAALAAQYIIASDPFFQSAQTYISSPFGEMGYKNVKKNKYG